MDGGRRLPRSLSVWRKPAQADVASPAADEALPLRKAWLAFGRSGLRVGSRTFVIRRGFGALTVFAFLGLVGTTGWFLGGHHETMRQGHGAVRDIAARAVGFPIRMVDVVGVNELEKAEVVAASGMNETGSLLFLDVAKVRSNVKMLPLVADATVRKLYPDRIEIQIKEREAFALWQQEGKVQVISSDGTVIDSLRDKRYLKLPHVVGKGAQLRAKEYAAMLDEVPDFRAQVRAGTLVSERRWTLKLTNGIDVMLPEHEPVAALRLLASIDKKSKVLSKDILAVDMRNPDRVAFRLSEEAGAQRNEEFLKRLPKIKGRA